MSTIQLQKVKTLAIQLTKFGAVGVLASLTHALIFHLLYTTVTNSHLIANVFAFLVAFVVSYAGHFHWTFRGESQLIRSQGAAFFRFFRTALIGLAINLFFAQATISWLGLHHYVYLTCLFFVTPIVVFLLTKFWVMKS